LIRTLGSICQDDHFVVEHLEIAAGDILEVSGDCPTFEEDVRKWCDRMKKTLLAVNVEGTAKVMQIQF